MVFNIFVSDIVILRDQIKIDNLDAPLHQTLAIYIAISRWSPISDDLRHIVVYMLYIENYCMKFLDGVVLKARSMVSLSLTLYCNHNLRKLSAFSNSPPVPGLTNRKQPGHLRQ